ncbi:MAG: helix-turn-helix domain-containing protein [Gemmatimonadetes bacterium]|nr:helix-turn-helix domain-containing protein [Gemmatimonadota bacterium]
MDERDLQRRQLDARLMGMPRERIPKGGWIRTIRRALGMTMAQLGHRLGVSAPAVADLEAREGRETVSVARLRAAADAMGCDLVIAFVPREPLTEMVRRQVIRKREQQDRRVLHTMQLENQGEGVTASPADSVSVDVPLAGRRGRLWD